MVICGEWKGTGEEADLLFNRAVAENVWGETTKHLTISGALAGTRTGIFPRTSEMRWRIFDVQRTNI
jgi:hypothetical protein